MDDALYAAAIAGDGDADAISKLEMEADRVDEYERTILHIASRKGNTERVRFILREFAHKNLLVKLDNQKCTALYWAANDGHTEAVEVLIETARHLPPSVDDNPLSSFQSFLRHADQDLETALYSAVKNGHLAAAKLLAEADPSDRHIQNKYGQTPIYIAAARGYFDIVKMICTTCTPPYNLDGPDGSTALHAAILNNNEDIQVVEVLIGAARLSSSSSDKDDTYTSFQAFLTQGEEELNTALHIAVMKGRLDTAKLLVEADPTATYTQNKDGETPIYIAADEGYNDIVKMICTTCTPPYNLDGPRGSTALHAAISNDNEDIQVVEVLIGAARLSSSSSDKDDTRTSFQAFLTQGDEYLDTALHIAVMKGKLATAKLLVEADPSATYIQNKGGETPIYRAAERGYFDIVKMICTTGTPPYNLDGPRGSTALHAAIQNGNEDIQVVEVLIGAARLSSSSSDKDDTHTSFQAFLTQGDEDFNTALHIAVRQGKLATAKLLVEADPTATYIQNKDGETPIYIAAERGYFDTVKTICTTCKSLSNLEGPRGSTALHAAIKNLHRAKKEDRDVIGIIIAKYANTLKDGVADKSDKDADEIDEEIYEDLVELFNKTDEDRCTILELAVERNEVEVVKLILAQNPAYAQSWNRHIISLMPLIYKATDEKYTHIVELLTQVYTASSTRLYKWIPRCRDMASLISAIEGRQRKRASMILDRDGVRIVKFVDNLGWTALHHAAYYEFDSIIDVLVQTQKTFGHQFMYEDKVLTPFHVAAGKGYTSTVIRLMRLWPSSSSAYTAIDRNEQNILHLAALQSKKEMIQGILKYCSEEYKNEFVNKQDTNGDTPLHILTRRGCYVPELMKYRGLHTEIKNKEEWTPRALLYFEDQIINDQVQIKIVLDDVESNHKREISESLVLPSKRQAKDVVFNERMRQDLERYKETHPDQGQWYADAVTGHAIAKAALEKKADTPNKEEETILHLESKRGDAERVRYIVEDFANKNLLGKLDRLKQTALHLAAHHGHTEVVEVLIDAARHLPSSSTNDDDTHNPVGPFQAFIRQAAGPTGNTALHVAVIYGKVATVKLLVEADPSDGHIQNCEGKTPIYIAAEKGYKDIIKAICTSCAALSLEGPGGGTTAFHALLKNIRLVTEKERDVIGMMINAARRWSAEDASHVSFEALCERTDESGSTILQLAVERNYVDAVELILLEDPGRGNKKHSLMRLIYKAIDEQLSKDIVKLLSEAYEAGIIKADHKGVLDLILAIKGRDKESVIRLLRDAKRLVSFSDDKGWTPLHYAAYHEFISIFNPIIEAQKEVGYQFVYGDKVPTPLHVAAEYGFTSTLIRLMQLCPASSSAYTAVNKNGQNILHLAAAENRKEMVQGILKYCPEKYKDKILKQQDASGDTPLHLLIFHGCFIPELIKHKGLTTEKNKYNCTPRDMLYFEDNIVADQVQIKFALDDVQTKKAAWKFWDKSMEKKMDNWESTVPPSKRDAKDVIFNKRKQLVMDKKHALLERYKTRTNTQIIVTAIITTVTFTVGFTMPGGLRQSEGKDDGLAVLSRKKAFNVFMVSDALALLLSTSSLFFYFLESMNDDPQQVAKLNAASTVLNIVSVVAMMLTFIAGTYVVLSDSPALAITVSIISSFFFLLIIILSIKIVYDRQVKKNKD